MAEFKLEQAVTAIRIGITHATGPIAFAATPCKILSSFVTANADVNKRQYHSIISHECAVEFVWERSYYCRINVKKLPF